MKAMSTNINRFTQAFCKVNHQNLYQNSLFSGAIAHSQRKFARNQAPLAMVHAVLSPVPALPCIDLCSVESFSILLISVWYQCLKLAQLLIPSETVFGCPDPPPFAWPTTSLSTFFSRFVHWEHAAQTTLNAFKTFRQGRSGETLVLTNVTC